jgi:hypothetical protein
MYFFDKKRVKVVSFKNGTYGVRVKKLFGRYVYVTEILSLWDNVEHIVDRCQFSTKEEAIEVANNITDKGTPIDD